MRTNQQRAFKIKQYQEIIIRYNDENAPIRVMHPLDSMRTYMFNKNICGDHKNYWRIANSQYENMIQVIPRNAFKKRGRYYVQRTNQSKPAALEKERDI